MSLNYLFTDPNTYIEKMSVNTFNSLSGNLPQTGALNMQFVGGTSTFFINYVISFNSVTNTALVFLDLSELSLITCDSSNNYLQSTNFPFSNNLAPFAPQVVGTIAITNITITSRNLYQVSINADGSLSIYGISTGFINNNNYNLANSPNGQAVGLSLSYLLN